MDASGCDAARESHRRRGARARGRSHVHVAAARRLTRLMSESPATATERVLVHALGLGQIERDATRHDLDHVGVGDSARSRDQRWCGCSHVTRVLSSLLDPAFDRVDARRQVGVDDDRVARLGEPNDLELELVALRVEPKPFVEVHAVPRGLDGPLRHGELQASHADLDRLEARHVAKVEDEGAVVAAHGVLGLEAQGVLDLVRRHALVWGQGQKKISRVDLARAKIAGHTKRGRPNCKMPEMVIEFSDAEDGEEPSVVVSAQCLRPQWDWIRRLYHCGDVEENSVGKSIERLRGMLDALPPRASRELAAKASNDRAVLPDFKRAVDWRKEAAQDACDEEVLDVLARKNARISQICVDTQSCVDALDAVRTDLDASLKNRFFDEDSLSRASDAVEKRFDSSVAQRACSTTKR